MMSRKMKRFAIAILLALSLVGSVCHAQKPLKQLPKKNEVFRPEALLKPISPELGEALVNGHGQKVTLEGFVKEPWDVYSDRDDNTTYSTPKDKDVYSSLRMGEKVRIARLKGDYALVYTPSDDENYPVLPRQVEWKGWIPVSRLLLWDKPLVSIEGFPMRVILSNVVLASTPADNSGKLYYNPAVNAVPQATLPKSDVSGSFFYVLKREGGMALLAKDKDLGSDMENLFGWVSSSSFYPWYHNLAVEPNWDIAAVENFSNIGFSSFLSEGANDNGKVGEVSFKKTQMPFFRQEFYRIPGNIWRFPFYRNVFGTNAQVCVPADSPFLTENNLSSTTGSDMDVVNVFFVMEGSRDLEDFFPAVAESLQGIEAAFGGREVHVGSVIYHDMRNEDFKTEVFPLSSPRDRRLADFIDRGADYGFQDNASLPALYPAINQVLENAGLRPSETNLIIVIGARGDDSSLGLEEIANRLDGSNVLLFGIQVQNNPAVRSNQMLAYQMSSMLDTKLNARAVKTGAGNENILRSVRHGENINTVMFSLNTPDNIYTERLYAQNEGLMETDGFNECLADIYAKVADHIAREKVELSSAVERTHLFRNLFTGMVDGSGRPFYKFVALYDQDEFDSMMDGFSKLYELGQKSEGPSRQLYNIVSGFLEKVPVSNPVKADDQGLYQALRIYEGLPLINHESAGPALKNVRDLKGFTPEDCNTFLGNFTVKYQYLMQVKHAPYPYTININGRTCYWIPVDYLP